MDIDIFNVIIIMNEAKIKLAKEKEANYDVNLQIRKKLKDRGLFYKINKDKAYRILKSVGVIEESLDETYNKLVNKITYKNLVISGNLNPNEEDVIINF